MLIVANYKKTYFFLVFYFRHLTYYLSLLDIGKVFEATLIYIIHRIDNNNSNDNNKNSNNNRITK